MPDDISGASVDIEQFDERMKRLRADGLDFHEAFERSQLEDRASWALTHSREHLIAWLFGGVLIESKVEIPVLGITVFNERNEGPFVFRAPYAFECRVALKSPDIDGLLDAVERLERFLGAWHVISMGRPINYYSVFTGSNNSEIMTALVQDKPEIDHFLQIVATYPAAVQNLVNRAAWWMRQSDDSILAGGWNNSVFAIYGGYWNAFECLVEAICILQPPVREPDSIRDRKISDYLSSLQKPPTAKDIDFCVQNFLKPGLKPKAAHALEVLFSVTGKQYFFECFLAKPKDKRLYEIRNDINHANITEYNFESRLRVDMGLSRLQMIVLNMMWLFGGRGFLLDTKLRSCHTCSNFKEKKCQLNKLSDSREYWRFVCDSYVRSTDFG